MPSKITATLKCDDLGLLQEASTLISQLEVNADIAGKIFCRFLDKSLDLAK